MPEKNNVFFTKEVYDTEVDLGTNADVLDRIYQSNVGPETRLPIEFFFVSDQEEKLKRLGLHLLTEFADYSDFKVNPYDGNFELSDNTHPLKMKLTTINE